MPYYENVFIARQEVSAASVNTMTEKFTELLKENGGEVTKSEYWGLRNLAYRIKKNRKGHYVLMNIDAPAPAVAEMERQMKYEEDILRYLTIKVDELDPEPSPMMQNKGRDERPGGRGGRDRDRGDRSDRGGRDRGERREAPAEAKEAQATDGGEA